MTATFIGQGTSFWAVISTLVAFVTTGAALWFKHRASRLDSDLLTQREVTEHLQNVMRRGQLESEEATAHPPRNLPTPAQDLTAALASHDCVLFIGAELGSQLGVTPWPTTLGRAIESLRQRYETGEWESLEEQLYSGETELVADLLRSRVTERYLRRVIAEVATEDDRRMSASCRKLAELPFAGVVTDLWSEAVPQLFRARQPTIIRPGGNSDLGALLHNDRFFVTRAHGTLSDEGSLILSWEDYRNAVSEDPPFKRFIASMLSSRCLLFIGVTETEIERFMLGSGVRRSGAYEHHALVPWHPGIELQAERLQTRFGVHLDPYDSRRGDAVLNDYLEYLSDSVRKPRHRPSLHHDVPVLTELHLENIGPFSELSLPLDERANVLLGDNASGKSTILRALALGLAGDSVELQPAAECLLRVGQARGSISIIAGREYYRTVLRRDHARGQVRILADDVSPVTAGSLLALGFPPLRGVTGAAPHGPASDPGQAPGPSDLMPLVLNEVDPRLQAVQQWVINTAMRAENSNPATSKLNESLIEGFFEIVADLTPGVRIEYFGINRDDWQVLIRTEDGVMPITQVSRGMTAVLSWVGVLLKRLMEAYPRRSDPAEQRPGLLLLDEIDLHLHPAWQRRIFPLLQERFVGLQMVVSTHSPLVVGSQEVGQLVHLERQSDRIVPEILTYRFQGWRSDQILTSPAFALPTSRDAITEARLREHAALPPEDRRTDAQRMRAAELARELHQRLPPPQETPIAREAAVLVGDMLERRLAEIPEERRRAVAAEAKSYLEQLRSGGAGA